MNTMTSARIPFLSQDTIEKMVRSLDIVYLVKLRDGVYKIGRTTNIRARMYQLHGEYKVTPVVIHKFRAIKSCEAEKRLHDRYDKRRLKGYRVDWGSTKQHKELFALTDADVTKIKRIAMFDGSRFISEWADVE